MSEEFVMKPLKFPRHQDGTLMVKQATKRTVLYWLRGEYGMVKLMKKKA